MWCATCGSAILGNTPNLYTPCLLSVRHTCGSVAVLLLFLRSLLNILCSTYCSCPACDTVCSSVPYSAEPLPTYFCGRC